MNKIPASHIDFNQDISLNGKRSQSIYHGWLLQNLNDTVTFTITPSVGSPFNIVLNVVAADDASANTIKVVNQINADSNAIAANFTAYVEGTPTEWNAFYPSVYNTHWYTKSPPGVSFTMTNDNAPLVDTNAGYDQSAYTGKPMKVSNVEAGTSDSDSANVAQVKAVPGYTVALVGSSTQWDASTNTPTLVDGTGTEGQFYAVHVAGTWNGIYYNIQDRVVYSGGKWVNDHNLNFAGSRSQSTYFGLAAGGAWSTTFVITPAGGSPINVPFSTLGTSIRDEVVKALNDSPALQAAGFYAYPEGADNEWNPYYPSVYNHGFLKGPKGVSFTWTTPAEIDRNAGLDLPALIGQAQQITNIYGGATGTFTTVDLKTVTVTNGIITSIV